MRFIMWKSVMLPGSSVKGWVSGVLWLFLVSVFASAYVTGRISVGTLGFAEACALTLGVIALIFEKKLSQPPEIVEQILYRIEHQTRS